MSDKRHPIIRLHERLTTTPAVDLAKPGEGNLSVMTVVTAEDPAVKCVVAVMANNLQALAMPKNLHIAPPREEIQERLRRAAQISRNFTGKGA